MDSGISVFQTNLGKLYNEDCLTWLVSQPSESIDCCITSPPYWGLRNYGNAGQLGQEPSPHEYISNMRNIFRELYRVLKKSGSLWLNVGDNYYGGPPKRQPKDACGLEREVNAEKICERCYKKFQGKPTRRFCSSACGGSLNRKRTGFERPKCLLGLPWRIAIGLVDDGYILRNDIIWHKPNAHPSPFSDRLSATHEHLFHFVKQGRYINGRTYDGSYHYVDEEMRIPSKSGGTKNIGDVWKIATAQSREDHYAAYPFDLIERPMRATMPPGGIVYDPFMGSGTTAVVAERNGFRWAGTEINPSYCSLVEKRVREIEAVKA